ncbi:methyltransferase domain-containing protein [Nocardia sp. CDC159]|uniref:Methyltransferase domain-containing protein n=1 Tax=Nocardia pulmonis TaxID=2951408 RepID=A0A9X2ECE8_9NOCA|nr:MULTISPECIES: methyltransferase domain-containing protein [Nocardia]MCM6775531.1 methyltransferase domain-containing protein [Nocardia pulmonis]MCM6787735.1 methyltransferase domain-containing protein [Nocardia sp. CDC159]
MSSTWALGDFHRFAKTALGELGPQLVTACGVGPGMRVLDVGTGSGTVAIDAAWAGAEVVGTDISEQNFSDGRLEALAQGVEIDWIEADAQDLPFPDSSFDVITSSAGAIVAPRHQDVADEFVRVVRPGGTLGLIAWTRRSWICEILATLAYYAPPPPDALPPWLWSNRDHVLWLFGDRIATLEATTRSFRLTAPSPTHFIEFFETSFAPIQTAFADLLDHPERAAALHADLLDLAARSNLGAPGAPAEYLFEYELMRATATA